MSRRHQSSRRKAYGRRQHEVRERVDRVRPDQPEFGFEADEPERREEFGAFALGLRERRFGFALD